LSRVLDAGLFFQRKATDKIPRHNSVLSAAAVLKAHDNHSMALDAAAPAIHAVFAADASGRDEFIVAGGADVVVPFVALKAVETGM
jgi:hypothetical protein